MNVSFQTARVYVESRKNILEYNTNTGEMKF